MVEDTNPSRRRVLAASGAALATFTGLAGADVCADCGGGGGGDTSEGPTVTTDLETVSGDRVTVYGSVTSLGDDTSVNVAFEWGPYGGGFPNDTELQLMSSTGQFCDGVDCDGFSSFGSLDPGDYQYRAYGYNNAGSDTGETRYFTIQ